MIKEYRPLKNMIHQIDWNESLLFSASKQGLRQNLTLICIKWVPGHPSTIYIYQLYSKNVRKLRFHVFLHFLAKIYDIIILPEEFQINRKIRTSFQFG